MSDDLAPTIALGRGSALLAFECFAALISLLQVRCASIRLPPSSAAQLQTTPARGTPGSRHPRVMPA